MEQPQPLPQILPPSTTCATNSPEFEFWMVGNPSFPQPNLLSADELFSDGFLLPLHLLQPSTHPPPPPDADKTPEPEPSPIEPAELSVNTNSKRWRHIFKKKLVPSSISTRPDDQGGSKEKREKKNGGAVGFGAGNVVSAAELNINIWPFSRSRSAGNGGTRPRAAPATRKVSSAPCSRSNSTGESKSRAKLPPHSPSRAAGVHLGRNSPVWQVRRGGGGSGRSSEAFVKNAEKGGRRDGNRKIPKSKATGLSLNVPMCIGYRNHLSCRLDESSTVSVASAGGGGASGEVVRRSNLFNIRSLDQ